MNRRALGIVVGLIGLVIVFETLQQLYYVRRFNLAEDDVQFIFLFKRQVYRWLIWAVMAVPLLLMYRKSTAGSSSAPRHLLFGAILISAVVFTDVLLISLLAYPWGTGKFDLADFTSAYLAFFTFQKAPLFTLGYIGVCWIYSLYADRQELRVEISTLRELRQKDLDLFKKVSQRLEPQENILTIRSGNQYSVVSFADIRYLEADDYCVNVYQNNDRKYVMRLSLKELDRKLPAYFLRVHRKYIVNCRQVDRFQVNPPVLSLKGGTAIPVAKSKLKLVKKKFGGEQIR